MTDRSPVERVRALLDIYASRPSSRLAVLATFAAGLLLLALGTVSGSASAVLPFGLLVWANHERFFVTVDGILARRGWLIVFVPLLVLAARLLQDPPTATDDLLRHIASAFFPDGYAGMYVETSLPPAPLYPVFDQAVGALARAIGPVPAMWIVQACAASAFIGGLVASARRLAGPHPFAWVLVLAALVVTLQVMGTRLALARPEIFLGAWVLFAFAIRGSGGAALWCAAGVLLGTGYWLAPVYFPAALVLPWSVRRRVAAMAAMATTWGLAWWWLTDGRALESIAWVLEQVGRRIPGFTVQENLGLAGVLLMPQMLVLVFASAWACSRSRTDNRILWLVAWFALPNQARYAGIIAPLLALHALPALAAANVRWPRHARAVAVALGAVSLSVAARGLPRLSELPRFELPSGAIVLNHFSEAGYALPFANPGRVRVSPAFEIGAATVEVQRLALALGEGRIDCGALKGTVFTHLVEDRLHGPPPPCVDLAGTLGRWRLWRISAPDESRR